MITAIVDSIISEFVDVTRFVVIVLFLLLLIALHLLGGRRHVNIVILFFRSCLLLARSDSLARGGLLGSWGGGVVGGDVAMAALEVAHDGLAEVLPGPMVSVCTWERVDWYIRDSIFGKRVAKGLHGTVYLGPVVAQAITIRGAYDDGNAEVALSVGIPLLLSRRHDDVG
ncbi:hypothetical protein HG530_015853 [Fusarium avenaceum]|nr:hypothetical protein HG530_015853 [Fusarium avenaceum]